MLSANSYLTERPNVTGVSQQMRSKLCSTFSKAPFIGYRSDKTRYLLRRPRGWSLTCFPSPMSETDLIKKLFPGGVWLDGKLQLGIHGGHPNVDLENRRRNLNLPVRSFPGGLRDLPPKPRAAWPCGCCTHSSLTSVLMPITKHLPQVLNEDS